MKTEWKLKRTPQTYFVHKNRLSWTLSRSRMISATLSWTLLRSCCVFAAPLSWTPRFTVTSSVYSTSSCLSTLFAQRLNALNRCVASVNAFMTSTSHINPQIKETSEQWAKCRLRHQVYTLWWLLKLSRIHVFVICFVLQNHQQVNEGFIKIYNAK